MLSNVKYLYRKWTNISLVVLWAGAMLLLLVMFYNWSDPSNKHPFFVDQLLRSAPELQLGAEVNLINITRNREAAAVTTVPQDSGTRTAPEREQIYSNLLKHKIKAASAESPRREGFVIKPLPQ